MDYGTLNVPKSKFLIRETRLEYQERTQNSSKTCEYAPNHESTFGLPGLETSRERHGVRGETLRRDT